MHIQWNNKNPTIPTQGNPHNDPPERNRQYTTRIHDQDKENPTSQAHRPNERRIPNKGCHASQNKHVEKTCNRPRQGTLYIWPNGYPEQGNTKTPNPKRNRNKNPGRNTQWSRNKDQNLPLETKKKGNQGRNKTQIYGQTKQKTM